MALQFLLQGLQDHHDQEPQTRRILTPFKLPLKRHVEEKLNHKLKNKARQPIDVEEAEAVVVVLHFQALFVKEADLYLL